MMEEHVYHEYANWQLDKKKFVQELKTKAPGIFQRLEPVLQVIEFLYDKLVSEASYTEEEIHIFQTGLYYLIDQIDDIEKILNECYQGNMEQLEIYAQDINLFLNAVDFQSEILNYDLKADQEIDRLMKIDQEIYRFIVANKPVPNETFKEIDDLSANVFSKHAIDYYSISDIFLEIADELNIIG